MKLTKKFAIGAIAGCALVCSAFAVTGCGEHKHSWDDGEVTTAAKCETPGVKTFTCTDPDCGEKKEEAVPAPGHTWGDFTVVTNPTATTTGTATTACTVSGCNAPHSAVLPVLGEGYTAGTDSATCTEPGTQNYSCTVEGKTVTFDVVTSAKGHSVVKIDEGTASCTQAGTKDYYYECPACHVTFSDEDATTQIDVADMETTHKHPNAVQVAMNTEAPIPVTLRNGTTVNFTQFAYISCPDCGKKLVGDPDYNEEYTAVYRGGSTYGYLLDAEENVFTGGSASYQADKSGKYTFTVTLGTLMAVQYAGAGNLAMAYNPNGWVAANTDGGKFVGYPTEKLTDTVTVYMQAGDLIMFGMQPAGSYGKAGINVAYEAPKVMTEGENRISVTEANSSADADAYVFCPTESKNYNMIVPAGLVVVKDGKDFADAGTKTEPLTASFKSTAGEQIVFCFVSATVGEYTVNIEVNTEGDINLEKTYTITEYPTKDSGVTFTVGDAVEEGDYLLTLAGGAAINNISMYIIVNWDGNVEMNGNNVKPGTDWKYLGKFNNNEAPRTSPELAITLHLKGGDTITVFNPVQGSGPEITASLTAK